MMVKAVMSHLMMRVVGMIAAMSTEWLAREYLINTQQQHNPVISSMLIVLRCY